MKIKIIFTTLIAVVVLWSCKTENQDSKVELTQEFVNLSADKDFPYVLEQFEDIKVLRYQISGWEDLTLKEQKLVYYLTQAGLSGRDIMWDQNYRHNLKIRKALESIYTNFNGDKTSDDWNAFEVYLKRVWFSNGIHHHYSNAKIKPEFTSDYFKTLLTETNTVLEGEAWSVSQQDPGEFPCRERD